MASFNPPRPAATEGHNEALGPFDLEQITQLLPHRFPFLLVDRILSLVPGRRVIGVKNVSANEAIHRMPGPIGYAMPGTLLTEAMAQCAAVMVMESLGEDREGQAPFFASIERMRFRRPIRPGDQAVMELWTVRRRGGFWRIAGETRVDGELVATALCGAQVLRLGATAAAPAATAPVSSR